MSRQKRQAPAALAGISLLAISVLAAACGAGGSSAAKSGPAQVVIGAPISLTGLGAGFGVPQLHAAQEEVAAINAAGGIKDLGGAKLKLDVADDQSNPTVATQLLRQMAARGDSAFIGPVLSSVLTANVPVIQGLHVPLFTPAAGDSITDNNAGYIFRVIQRASGFADSMASYLKSLETSRHVPITRMAIVDVSLEPGPSVASSFVTAAKASGWQTQVDTYDPATADFSPLVSKLATYKPQVVVGYQDPNDAVLFAKAVAGQKWRPAGGFGWIFGGQDLNSFKASLGTAVNGWLDAAYTAGLSTSRYPASVQAIARKYAASYHQPLNGNQGSLAAIVGLVADAVSAAKSSNPVRVAAAARKLDFSSPAGSAYPFPQAGGVKFNASQDNTGFVTPIIQLEGTAADPVQVVVSPASLTSGNVIWPAGS
ncbi:MAG TPA: ABC transporter substrate-binding protein [Streptosporangiaceae bacterium]|jgi:branched-chain amino acid transport system substrate-binding protein|nr:ABC transporter substrate-binding protein [Streptosporangiaceae bacterium]